MPKFLYDGEDNRPDYIAAGEYTATVIDAKEGKSQAGNEKIQLTWQTDKPKWKVWDTLVFTKNSKWKVDAFLVAVGMAPAKGKEVDITPESITGARAYVQIAVDPVDANGKVWNSIAKYITDKGLPPAIDADAPNTSNTVSEPDGKLPNEDNPPMGDGEKKSGLPF